MLLHIKQLNEGFEITSFKLQYFPYLTFLCFFFHTKKVFILFVVQLKFCFRYIIRARKPQVVFTSGRRGRSRHRRLSRSPQNIVPSGSSLPDTHVHVRHPLGGMRINRSLRLCTERRTDTVRKSKHLNTH